IKRGHQLSSGIPFQWLELGSVRRLQIEFVQPDHGYDPCGHRGDQRCKIAQRHRFVVWLPVIVPFGDSLQRQPRAGSLALELSKKEFRKLHSFLLERFASMAESTKKTVSAIEDSFGPRSMTQ